MRTTLLLLALASISLAQPSWLCRQHDDPWFGVDKAEHIATCLGISFVSYVVADDVLHNHWKSLAVASAATMAVGFGKELYDIRGEGFSWRDICADAVGVAITAAISTAVNGRRK